MMKFNFSSLKIARRCYGSEKWNIPRELLSNSISNSKGIAEHPRSESMQRLLKQSFPKAKEITVTDLSGSCGAMFEVVVVSEEFKGLPLLKQHKLVTKALSTDINKMHGIRIETIVPNTSNKS